MSGNCYTNYMSSHMGCSLPWARHDTKNSSLRECSSPQDLQLFHNLSELLFSSDVSTLQSLTGCLPSCAHFEYKLNTIPDIESRLSVPYDVSPWIHKLIAFGAIVGDRSYLVEREVLMHGMGDLVADIGGYLGLLLGVSCLDVFDILPMLMKWLFGPKLHQ